MRYVGGIFVDIAEISKISYVYCGLYLFRKGISFFEILTLSPNIDLSFLYLVRSFFCTELRGNQYS